MWLRLDSRSDELDARPRSLPAIELAQLEDGSLP